MTSVSALFLLQNDSSGMIGALFSGTFLLVWLAIMVVVIIGGWRVFEKAGEPGWAILIPIYNTYILIKIAGREWWWLLLMLIPLVGIIIAIIVSIDVAKSFGKSAAWGFFLLFLFCGIGYLILGFGDARYIGPAAKQNAGALPAA